MCYSLDKRIRFIERFNPIFVTRYKRYYIRNNMLLVFSDTGNGIIFVFLNKEINKSIEGTLCHCLQIFFPYTFSYYLTGFTSTESDNIYFSCIKIPRDC